MVDNYLDSFLILASDAGYTDPRTLVVKFRRGLKLNVQSQISTMPFGQPVDTDLEAWYAVARRINQVWLANKVFQSTLRLTTVTPVCFALARPTPFSVLRSPQQLRPPFCQGPLRLCLHHLVEYP